MKSLQGFFESYINRTEHNAVGRYKYKEAEIYLSEGGPYYISDFPLASQNELQETFPSGIGWFEATYAIGRGDEILMWQPIAFDYMHDPTLTTQGRKQARINTAMATAKDVVDKNPELFTN